MEVTVDVELAVVEVAAVEVVLLATMVDIDMEDDMEDMLEVEPPSNWNSVL